MTNTVTESGPMAERDLGDEAAILRLGNSFCDAQSLLTAVEFDLFTMLRDGATTEEVRARLGLHGRGLSDFLRLLVALGLLVVEDGRYRNGADADRYLVRGKDSYIGDFLHGTKHFLYPVWGGLADAIRTGRPQAGGDFEVMLNHPEMIAPYVRMMDGLMQVLGAKVIDALDFTGCRTVLDAGGCRGNLASQIVKAHPDLDVTVFDREQLKPFSDEYLAKIGLTGKVSFVAGNFFTDPLPAADVVIFGHILHDWDPGERAQLLRTAYAAVNPGGILAVYDRMLPENRQHRENLIASINMRLVTPGGSEYTVSELTELGSAAGFIAGAVTALDENETLVVLHKGTD